MIHPLSHISLLFFQICCQCWSLLRNACCQEETYITEEEGGTTVDDSFHSSFPVFLCPSHLSFQHGTRVPVPTLYYLFICFLTSPPPSLSTSSPRDEDASLSCLPDFRKPHTRCGCLLSSYTTAIYKLTHFSQSTCLSRLLTTFLSLVQHLAMFTLMEMILKNKFFLFSCLSSTHDKRLRIWKSHDCRDTFSSSQLLCKPQRQL